MLDKKLWRIMTLIGADIGLTGASDDFTLRIALNYTFTPLRRRSVERR